MNRDNHPDNHHPYTFNFDPDEDEDEDWIPLSDTNTNDTVTADEQEEEEQEQEQEQEGEDMKLTSNESSPSNRGNDSPSQQEAVIPPHEYSDQFHDHVDNSFSTIHDSHFGPTVHQDQNQYQNQNQHANFATTSATANFTSTSTRNNNNNNNNNGNEGESDKLRATLDTIRKRHERNRNLKETLTERPLAMLPKILFCHLMREFWNSHRYIRLGIIFIVTGICLQLSSFGILFFFSLYKLPQLIISSIIIGLISYFTFFHLDNPLHDFIKTLSSKEKWQNGKEDAGFHHFILDIFFTCLEYVNGVILRRICLCVFFILPIVMEMKALIFLSSLVTDGVITTATTTNMQADDSSSRHTTKSFFIGCSICWIFVLVQLILFIPMHFKVRKSVSSTTSTGVAATALPNKWENGTYQFGPVVLSLKSRPGSSSSSTSIPSSLFEIRIHFWAYLYTLALVASTFMMSNDNFQIHKPILLAAPFLLVTGSFIILSCHREDEDLFLNILRRALEKSLIDVMQFVGEDIAEDDMLKLNMIQWIVDNWATTTTSASDGNHRQDTTSDGGGYDPLHPTSGRPSSVNSSTPPPSSTTTAGTNDRYSNPTINSNPNTSNNPRMSSPQPNTQSTSQRPRTKIGVELPSFINIDERARPAVLSYKKAVNDFPPSRNTCIILAIAKRCPAILSVSCLHLSGSLNASFITIVLIPMMILETMRTCEWINACDRAIAIEKLRAGDNTNDEIQIQEGYPIYYVNEKDDSAFLPKEMEPMEILLSTDSYSPFDRGSSLQVWMNVQSSVVALESSLTAMKCVNTANIATDVAFDVMSLAKFGLEVKDKGLPYGVSVLAKDLFQFHLERSMNNNSSQSSRTTEANFGRQGGSYSKTAINLVNNGQVLSKNIVELIEDGKKEDNILHPLVSGISVVLGKGWLWGKEEDEEEKSDDKSKSSSTPENSNNEKSDDNDTSTDLNCDGQELDQVRDNGNSVALSDGLDRLEQTITLDSDQSTKLDSPFDDLNYDVEPVLHQSGNEDNSLPTQMRENHDNLEKKANEQSEPTESTSARSEVSAMTSNSNEDEQRKQTESPIPRGTEQLQHDIVAEDGQNDNNGFNLLGAGLAVLAGAVVGGIALAAKGEEDERRNKRRTTNKSTVTIERLDDEE